MRPPPQNSAKTQGKFRLGRLFLCVVKSLSDRGTGLVTPKPHTTRGTLSKETISSSDPTVGSCLGPYVFPSGGGVSSERGTPVQVLQRVEVTGSMYVTLAPSPWPSTR